MERPGQLVLRNENRLAAGSLLLVNPCRDTLFRQLQSAERPVRISTQDYGDQCWLAAAGADVSFDVIPEPEPSCQTVILVLPREKDRLAMMLHAIACWLPDAARLWLAGANRAGIKSAGRYLQKYFRNVAKLDSARHCVLFEASGPVKERPFVLSEYESCWPVVFAGHELRIASLPGVFSNGRLDPGSRLLLDVLEKQRPGGRILDFACGSGVIACSLLAADASGVLTLLDVSALALEASRRSLELNGQKAAVLASDGLSELGGQYDWIISNPPFHRGVSNDLEIAARFFGLAGTFLAENGRIVIVCNRHLPYERWLQEGFYQIERLDENDEFFVIQASKPR